MNDATKTHALLLLSVTMGIAAAEAGPRNSASYRILTESVDHGGKLSTSAIYRNDGSICSVAGISSVAVPANTVKVGYIAQLYEVTGLVVTSATTTVNEAATLQLSAWELLDDVTYLDIPASWVSWSVVNGPIASISDVGLASAGIVFQSTPAMVKCSFGNYTSSLNLTVLDSITDNFSTYAGDGIGDDWQVQYFGQNNPLAGPNIDVSGTGQTNLFKYIAGLNPLNPNSRFTLRIEPVPGHPEQKSLIFSPRFNDRTYTVKAKPSLITGTYSALVHTSISDSGQERTVTDLNATGATKFYQVEIVKP